MGHERLIAALETLEPLDLKGVGLLRQLRAEAGYWVPDKAELDTETVAEATIQMMQYLSETRRITYRLKDLEPVPLDMPILEFGL